MPRKIVVKQDPENEIPTEVLAESIVAVSESLKKLRTGRLSDRALFLLIRDAAPSSAKLNMREIKAVFDGIDNLQKLYIRKVLK